MALLAGVGSVMHMIDGSVLTQPPLLRASTRRGVLCESEAVLSNHECRFQGKIHFSLLPPSR